MARMIVGVWALFVAAWPAAAQNSNVGQIGTQALAAIPLASHPQGQSMMQQAMNRLLPDVDFTFLDKTYEDDQYVSVGGQRVRTACVRFRATSGFRFKIDPPQFTLTTQGLTVTQTIPVIDANALTFKFQLGPCADVAAGFRVKLTNVRLVYRARPTLSFDQQVCKLSMSSDSDEINVTIGGLNVINVQNDLDKLAKKAVEDGINYSLDKFLSSGLRSALTQIVNSACGAAKRAR